MLTTLTGGATITADIDVRRLTWTVLAGRRFGSASLRVPEGHTAYSRTYLRAGAAVRIEDDALGTWDGIMATPKESGGVVTAEVRHQAAVLSVRRAPPTGEYSALTAGYLALTAARQAVEGLANPPLTLGTFVEAAPVIETYNFTGQTLAELFGDLMERTGQEARVENNVLSWGQPQAAVYGTPLYLGSDLLDPSWEADADQRIADVIGVGTGTRGGRYRTRDAEAAASGWPVQELVLSSGSSLTLAQRSEMTLAASRRPRERLTARLIESRWDVREGDIVTVVDAGSFSGRVTVGRVVQRTWEAPGVLTVEVQIQEDAVPATVMAIADTPTPAVRSWQSLYRDLAAIRVGVGRL